MLLSAQAKGRKTMREGREIGTVQVSVNGKMGVEPIPRTTKRLIFFL
jgi:hypothetical protein